MKNFLKNVLLVIISVILTLIIITLIPNLINYENCNNTDIEKNKNEIKNIYKQKCPDGYLMNGFENKKIICKKTNPSINNNSWEKISLSDNTFFDNSCFYRFQLSTEPTIGLPNENLNRYYYSTAVGKNSIIYIGHNGITSHIDSNNKKSYKINGKKSLNITNIEKLCLN